jgi:hypothetical protein
MAQQQQVDVMVCHGMQLIDETYVFEPLKLHLVQQLQPQYAVQHHSQPARLHEGPVLSTVQLGKPYSSAAAHSQHAYSERRSKK